MWASSKSGKHGLQDMPFLPNIIKSASQVRDLILILVTGAYALGFALWSVNAWREGLGWIPIANTQYFITPHNETLSVAMRVNNPDCSAVGIHGRDRAKIIAASI